MIYVELPLIHSQGMCNKWTHTTNIQVTKTSTANMQVIKSYVQLIQMTKLVSAQVTQTSVMTKLPIKHYETHTTTKIHGETIPTMI